MRFNPFRANVNNLFDVFEAAKNDARVSRTPFISHYNNLNSAQAQMELLAARMSRFLVLEMLLENHFHIANRRAPFAESISRADFHFGGFQSPIPRPSSRPHVQESTDPLAHIPKPNATLSDKAKKVAAELDDKLPQECCDPISMEPLADPIEINKRVYNRETVSRLIKDGKFEDPFNRAKVDPSTAKPAHYMLDAIIAHSDVLAHKEPIMLRNHKSTDVHPLKDLIEQWGQLLRAEIPAP
ncbi:hypothetical protein HRQ65_03150 [Tatlockia micdadei]|nr:hypothetical protein [Legionella micdadei]